MNMSIEALIIVGIVAVAAFATAIFVLWRVGEEEEDE